MKAVKNRFREKDEIEAYFSDAKRKSIPGGVILFLLILVLLGGCGYYYFVIDSPKNIFLNLLNQLSTNLDTKETNYEKTNIDFSLDLNLLSPKKEYLDLTNIINELSITGNLGMDTIKKEDYLNIKALYQEKDLFGLTGYLNEFTTYIKLDNIYNKVLKDELNEEDKKELDKMYEVTDKENENTDKLIDSVSKHLVKVLENAKYTKTYEKLDKPYVKKLTIQVDTNLIKEFLNNLLNDNDFIESYSKLESITESEAKENLTNIKNKLTKETLEVSTYLSIIENKLIKLEFNFDYIRVVLTKDNNEINYKYYEDSIIKYQGYVYLKDNGSNYQISLSLEDIEQELTIELNSEITIEHNQDINTLDTTNTIDVDTMTDADYNKIMENIANNENLNILLEDFLSIFAIYSEDNSLQTT